MKINTAEFVKSIGKIDQLPRDVIPQIAFAGRSNVGKSSLMNSLLNRKKLVKVSSTPGKTRTLNLFLINQSLYFVDLPGYGFAKVSKTMQQEWQALMEQYLLQCRQLQLPVLLFDLRHPVTRMDMDFIDWLQYHDIAHLLVGTKADKLSKNQLAKQISSNEKLLKQEFGRPLEIIPYSSVTGMGKEKLWAELSTGIKDTK